MAVKVPVQSRAQHPALPAGPWNVRMHNPGGRYGMPVSLGGVAIVATRIEEGPQAFVDFAGDPGFTSLPCAGGTPP